MPEDSSVQPNEITLSKTDFLVYLDCPLHLWAAKHERLEITAPAPFQLRLMAQGREVEALAGPVVRDLAGEAELVDQPELVDGPFHARPDHLVRHADGRVDLVEVKSSSSPRKEHEYDLAFQALVGRAGLDVDKRYLVYVNKEYVRRGEIDPRGLFVVEDLTEPAAARRDEVLEQRALALAAVRQETPLGLRGCTDPDTCPCPALCHPDLPENPIYDLPRLGRKALELKAMGVTAIEDIPADFPLTDTQRAQVELIRRGEPQIDGVAIRGFLAGLKFPLYFLDYETVNPALPLFDGYHPYDLVVFQFSLHIVEEPGATPVHHEHLALDPVDPAPGLAAALAEALGPHGSVLVWNRSFEARSNRMLAEHAPEKAAFFADLDARLVDLMDVFRNGHYRHPGFRGSASLKKVLPVLAPGMSYETLRIGDGEAAMQAWWRLLMEDLDVGPRADLEEALLVYCAQDTAAMMAIWEVLAGF